MGRSIGPLRRGAAIDPRMPFSIERIVSGGQTGVDRAALDAAIQLGIAHWGWCPRGRIAEDGPIPGHYQLEEAESSVHAERTELNVRDSDASLILSEGTPEGGTALTVELARRRGRPYLIVDMRKDVDVDAAREWLRNGAIRVLNVAGPRESRCPGIYARARDVLKRILEGDGQRTVI
jgi:hypothetical protein